MRKSIRLKDYDYSSGGAYFITICTNNWEELFNKYWKLKEIVSNQWENVQYRYPNVIIDERVIMPNHIHGIIALIDNNSLGVVRPRREPASYIIPPENISPDMVRTKIRAGARPAPTKNMSKMLIYCIFQTAEGIIFHFGYLQKAF